MANIIISKQDETLINAAIKLGDWLLSLPEVSELNGKKIRAIQQALKKLPKINDATFSMYGFSIERGDELEGLVRGWDVSLEYFSDDHDRQGGLELFSSYISIPESTDKTVLANKANNEVYFHWPVGDVGSHMSQEQQHLWIADLKTPLQHWQAGDRLRIEIVHQDHYAEIDCTVSK
jgi:hypothetical protein